MEKYEISKEEYLRLKKKYNLKKQTFSGVWCHNCTNSTYKVVKRNEKYYYECSQCGVLDNEN